eukprot:2116674-Amphidinium_carterae.1
MFRHRTGRIILRPSRLQDNSWQSDLRKSSLLALRKGPWARVANDEELSRYHPRMLHLLLEWMDCTHHVPGKLVTVHPQGINNSKGATKLGRFLADTPTTLNSKSVDSPTC